MKVAFSQLAAFKLEKLLHYLSEEWSTKSRDKFLRKLDASIQTLAENPEIFPTSPIDSRLRKCVISKQSSLLYEIHADSIFIVNVFDNRQDKKMIHEEIKKHFG